MTVASGVAGEWRYVDGIEDVTHTPRDGSADSGVKAQRKELSFREVSSGGPVGIEPTDSVWEVWDETVDVDPSQGGTITDSSGVVWVILSVTTETLGAVRLYHRCVCRQQV